jgi:hypothetical protein
VFGAPRRPKTKSEFSDGSLRGRPNGLATFALGWTAVRRPRRFSFVVRFPLAPIVICRCQRLTE